VSSLYGGYRAQRKAQREMPLFPLQQPTDPGECLRGIREMAQLLVQVCIVAAAAVAAYLALPVQPPMRCCSLAVCHRPSCWAAPECISEMDVPRLATPQPHSAMCPCSACCAGHWVQGF
jgi:hypothetical protein